jgi:TolB-like protein/tetratricopeptide (TPR) repeat protein
MSDRLAPSDLAPGHRIGRYVVIRALGRGGMGVVYVARDERLGRDIALKMIAGLPDETARSRFWREARAAASVSHPHVCQVFEVDETAEGIFLAMELLQGEPLDVRLKRGPLPAVEAAPIAIGILGALGALHARGLVHRDVKPSNVFLSEHGAKLLDFGLARPVASETLQMSAQAGAATVTQAGIIIGTPQYMAPEQVTGAAVDGRTDLYAAGAVLFQMLAGRPPFAGLAVDVMFAALHEHPPALEGPPAVVAMDRVIRRAMDKDPAARFQTAEAMSAELSAVSLSGGTSTTAIPVRALTRVVVPPIRLARTDPDISYLAFGLAEAMSGSLAALDHIVVRSPAVAAKWTEAGADPRHVAAEADVDLVVSSTLLRSGPQLRATAQLLDASGTVLGSTSVKGTMDDIFALEDALTVAAVGLLQSRRPGTPIPERAPAPVRRDVPASPRAFELFLRGLEHARHLAQTHTARDLFDEAVQEDPKFAPAWAALGRCHRVYGKFFADREESDRKSDEAFRRALELSPELPMAHRYLTHREAESGRAADAIRRLLRHARTNRHDAELFAGLVHACRYAGLVDASLAAHEEARRLDPNVETSVEYTQLHLVERPQDAARVFSAARRPDTLGTKFVLATLGSVDPALLAELRAFDRSAVPPAFQWSIDAMLAAVLEPPAAAVAKVEQAIAGHVDPEAVFLFGMTLIRLGNAGRGLQVVGHAVRAGYTPASTLELNWLFDGLRGDSEFEAIAGLAHEQEQAARAVFEQGGGAELLGLPSAGH